MENKTATIEDAIAIAAQAHKGQQDKAGAPNILHPLRLVMKMKSEAAMIVSILVYRYKTSDAGNSFISHP